MSDDKDQDLDEQQATDALLSSLNARADAAPARDTPQQEEEEGGEDIEAFLAELEDGAAQRAGSDVPAAEPDPFADAFAELDELHGDEVEQELAAKYEAPEPVAPPAPREATPAPTLPQPGELEEPEEQESAAQAAPEEADPAGKKKKKKKKVAVVESQQAPSIGIVLGTLKWTFLLLPVMLLWWVVGAFLGTWISTGWIIALIATSIAFVLPLVLWLVTKRGRWVYWASALGVVALMGILAPFPGAAGEKIAHYGHWPATTVAQLAGWEADHMVPAIGAFGGQFLGEQLQQLAGVAPEVQEVKEGEEDLKTTLMAPRALGLETNLKEFARAQREAAKPAPKVEARDPEAGDPEAKDTPAPSKETTPEVTEKPEEKK